jgi:hypothetical protein
MRGATHNASKEPLHNPACHGGLLWTEALTLGIPSASVSGADAKFLLSIGIKYFDWTRALGECKVS